MLRGVVFKHLNYVMILHMEADWVCFLIQTAYSPVSQLSGLPAGAISILLRCTDSPLHTARLLDSMHFSPAVKLMNDAVN